MPCRICVDAEGDEVCTTCRDTFVYSKVEDAESVEIREGFAQKFVLEIKATYHAFAEMPETYTQFLPIPLTRLRPGQLTTDAFDTDWILELMSSELGTGRCSTHVAIDKVNVKPLRGTLIE